MSQLRPDQLAAHLKQNLLPVYFVHGDEPLQVAECTDLIRAAARQQGYTDREVFSVEPGFDWGESAGCGRFTVTFFRAANSRVANAQWQTR